MARLYIGLDLGTSGCRAIAIDETSRPIAEAEVGLAAPRADAAGRAEQDPEPWWEAVKTVLQDLARQTQGQTPEAICVDATSGTLLLAGPSGQPLGPALMYNDRSSALAADRVAELAPADSPAIGPSASLAKLLALSERLAPTGPALALHQADWIIGRLLGRYEATDWNNALKLGFDCERLEWPGWVRQLIPRQVLLPQVLPPGAELGRLAPSVAADIGFGAGTRILAGTTDSTAAVIAAGATAPGDAVTSLGSTLVVKIVSDRPVTASRFGIYSHRFGDGWLVGGASNSGGAVLRQFFSDAEIAALSASIDPSSETGLAYYPLPATGERFPYADPAREPLLDPRPKEPVRFLQGLLEGIAAIEAEGYRRLAELGAPTPTRVWTVGGGAANETWAQIRSRALRLPVQMAEQRAAAYGAAKLALTRSRRPKLAPHRDSP